MAVIKTPTKASASIKVNAGTDPNSGSMIVRSVSLGSIKAGADKDMIMNVVDCLANVLEYSAVRVEQSETYTLEKNG